MVAVLVVLVVNRHEVEGVTRFGVDSEVLPGLIENGSKLK